MTVVVPGINPKDIPKDIMQMLAAEEVVYFKAKQARYLPGGKEVNPGEMFITNQRMIQYSHKLFGRGTITDVAYHDIANIELKKGMFSSEITLKPRFDNDIIKISAIKRDEAFAMESIIRTGIREARRNEGGL